MDRPLAHREAEAWAALGQVHDPEIPVISIVDLGIVRGVRVSDDGGAVTADLTPTYSGCPAVAVIEQDAAAALREHFASVQVRTVLSPPWTTDWISERGREQLREAGIAPPPARPAPARQPSTMRTLAVVSDVPVAAGDAPEQAAGPACPRCGAARVERISQFGSTACKSLWRCEECREPFDHFKAL